MAQSLSRVCLHLIFSTKNREPLLGDDIRSELHAYMASIFQDLGCPAVLINSVEDHAHVLFELSRTKAISDIVEQVKKGTSKWIKTKGPRYALFAWQAGYGIFAVSQSNIPRVRDYIGSQQEHHRKQTFKEEFLEFLVRHKVTFDEKYLWD